MTTSARQPRSLGEVVARPRDNLAPRGRCVAWSHNAVAARRYSNCPIFLPVGDALINTDIVASQPRRHPRRPDHPVARAKGVIGGVVARSRQPRPLAEVVARYRATTSPLRRGCRAVPRQPRVSHLSRARPGGLGARGAGGAGPRGLDNSDAQFAGTFRVPATREGLSRARPGGLGGRGAGGAGPRQCLYYR